MPTDMTSLVHRPSARRKVPACGTCRKKCRKCDRKRPICDRCRTKGLYCEGYPPRFQFCEVIAVPSHRTSDDISPGSIGGASHVRPQIPHPAPEELPSRSRSLSAPDTSFPSSFVATNSPILRTSVSPDPVVSDSAVLSLPSPLSPAKSASFSPVQTYPPVPPHWTDSLDDDLHANQSLIEHFSHTVCEHLTVHVEGTENMLRKHVLPLAYQHKGILDAVLGLSACHLLKSSKKDSQHLVTASLQYRVSALHSLGSLLLQEEVSGLSTSEESCVLALVLILVLHDICETGISSYGAHLTGVSFLCKRLASPENASTLSESSIFLISALAWLDMLRGFSGAEKLAYPKEVRECIRDHGNASLHTLVGCPAVIFFRISEVLDAGKAYLAKDLALETFQQLLDDAEKFLRAWEPNDAVYPTKHQEWKQLAEAYRHACLLRILRFPDAFAISCEDPRIKASVSAILDVCAAVPIDSVFYKRLLFPLFLAGVDTSSPHQMQYASWCVGQIKRGTGFQHPAMTDILTTVWKERRSSRHGWSNVPWTEFTCSETLQSQHAYLFF